MQVKWTLYFGHFSISTHERCRISYFRKSVWASEFTNRAYMVCIVPILKVDSLNSRYYKGSSLLEFEKIGNIGCCGEWRLRCNSQILQKGAYNDSIKSGSQYSNSTWPTIGSNRDEPPTCSRFHFRTVLFSFNQDIY